MSDSATPWTVACQTPPSMGFHRQEYWSALPFPFPGDLPDPEIETWPPAFQADSLLYILFIYIYIYILVSYIICVCVLQSTALRLYRKLGQLKLPLPRMFPKSLEKSKGHPEMGPGAKQQVVSWDEAKRT